MTATLHRFPLLASLAAAVLLAACATAPPPRAAHDAAQDTPVAGLDLGHRMAASALAEVGKPYRYGGNGPDAFDCSGLVRYAYAAQAVAVPRTTEEQFRSARPVPVDQIVPGDLLFFRFDGPKVSHVAIYTGNGRFVHAPQSGRSVETRSLDEPWYRSQFVGAGRLH